jgi:hypothetical protein
VHLCLLVQIKQLAGRLAVSEYVNKAVFSDRNRPFNQCMKTAQQGVRQDAEAIIEYPKLVFQTGFTKS